MRKSLLIFSIIIVVFFGLKKTAFALFSTKKIHCFQAGSLSDDYCASIKNHAHALLNKHCSAQDIITQLKKEYPLLDTIKIAYRPSSTYIMLSAYKPLCCINTDQVFAADHQLYPKDFFTQQAVDSLAHMTIAPEYILKTSFLVPELLNALPPQFNETYNLELLHEHHVQLIDKHDQHFSIITSIGQKKLPELLMHCSTVKKNLSERKDFNRSQWRMDTRFAQYIIAYKT